MTSISIQMHQNWISTFWFDLIWFQFISYSVHQNRPPPLYTKGSLKNWSLQECTTSTRKSPYFWAEKNHWLSANQSAIERQHRSGSAISSLEKKVIFGMWWCTPTGFSVMSSNLHPDLKYPGLKCKNQQNDLKLWFQYLVIILPRTRAGLRLGIVAYTGPLFYTFKMSHNNKLGITSVLPARTV